MQKMLVILLEMILNYMVIIIELKNLFNSGKIGNVTIKNRIVRSATWESRATEDGYVTDALINFYEELAKGGTGLIITGYLAVDKKGAQTIRMSRIDNDSYISGQKKLIKTIHNYSNVKVAAQISHTGNNVISKKLETIGPSPIRDPVTKKTCRELKKDEIQQIVKKFIDAGTRVYECGYDMVQIQACHGYLLSDFISPFTNRRTDEYGGELLNRLKIVRDIFNGIRDNLGKSFPIIAKLITQDYLGPGKGLTLDEGIKVTEYFVKLGIDAIEPTSGRTNLRFTNNKSFPSVNFSSSQDEDYFLSTVKKLKPIMEDCPLILMGGIRNPLSAERILKDNNADFISLSRPLIYEPNLPNRWKNGDLSPSLCTNCNACFGIGVRREVYCTVRHKLESKE